MSVFAAMPALYTLRAARSLIRVWCRRHSTVRRRGALAQRPWKRSSGSAGRSAPPRSAGLPARPSGAAIARRPYGASRSGSSARFNSRPRSERSPRSFFLRGLPASFASATCVPPAERERPAGGAVGLSTPLRTVRLSGRHARCCGAARDPSPVPAGLYGLSPVT